MNKNIRNRKAGNLFIKKEILDDLIANQNAA